MNTILSKSLKQIINLKQRIDRHRPFDSNLNQAIQEKMRIEWTYNSNALEGNTLTLGETAFFLREGLTSEGKPLKDFLEAKNHAEAIRVLEDMVHDKKNITEHFIKSLHQILLKGIEYTYAKGLNGKLIQKPLTPGKYKIRPNHVLTVSGNIHTYTEPEQVQIEMEKLIQWYNSDEAQNISAIERAAIFHYQFVSIHPFDDGNGRLARLLMNLILMKDGFPPCIIQNENRKQYLSELEKTDLMLNSESFQIFIAKELKRTMEVIYNLLLQKEFVEPWISPTPNREERRKMILFIARGKTFSIGQMHNEMPEIKRPTLKKDLQDLVKEGKLKTEGVGKGVIYSLSKEKKTGEIV
jgi:Fic family protein